jgi:glycerate 2-kinase
MKFLLSPCSYKGTISAPQLAAALAQVLEGSGHEAEVLPIADGGDDTLSCLKAALGGEFVYVNVIGPLRNPVRARFFCTTQSSKTESESESKSESKSESSAQSSSALAVIELASTSGIAYLGARQRDCLGAHTYGFGQAIRRAILDGARDIVLTLGGSASTDGGAGALMALGARFETATGESIELGGGGLAAISSCSFDEMKALTAQVKFTIASDVVSPLLGEYGAAAVFAPQKGADPAQVEQLEAALKHYADVMEGAFARRLRDLPGAGSAGGAGFGLALALNAPIISGFDWLASMLDLEKRLADCDIVVIAEGRLDGQSLAGKASMQLARRAHALGKRVMALPASISPDFQSDLLDYVETTSAGAPADLSSVRDTFKKMLSTIGP